GRDADGVRWPCDLPGGRATPRLRRGGQRHVGMAGVGGRRGTAGTEAAGGDFGARRARCADHAGAEAAALRGRRGGAARVGRRTAGRVAGAGGARGERL
ncbi:MAG: hypothetical protein AVDCRST_MAG39-343, partial [uncultured Sphingomonadaceae bacterium]